MGFAKLALAIAVVGILLVPLLPSARAPPLVPYEAQGLATNEAGAPLALGTPIRTFIDGVDYSNLTVTYRPDGSYQTRIVGNYYIGPSSETPWLKEGGDPGDPVAFASGDLTTSGRLFRQAATWQTAVFQNLNIQEAVASTQPALLKIQTVTTRPADLLTQYAYLCNPTGTAVDLADYYFQRDAPGTFTGPTVNLVGTIGANAKLFGDLQSTSYLTLNGDALKLVWANPGGAGSPFGGSDVVVDRVEFNASSAGALTWEPGNTIMTDALAPGFGQEIHRATTCTDTNQGADFILGPETGRPTAPTVTVTAPNGGERWTGGSPHAINWTMSDAQELNSALRVRINYSLDSGTTWITIVPSQPGTGNPNSYTWNVPTDSVDHTTVRVQVCATDSTLLTGCDASDADFMIDNTAPLVTTRTPGRGELNVLPNQDLIVVFSETMNRAATEGSFSITPNPGPTPKTFQWSTTTVTDDTLTVPLDPLNLSTTYTVTFTTAARDSSNPGKPLVPPDSWTFSTLTNGAPTLSFNSPVGGERWSGGSSHPITWTMSDDNTLFADLVVYLNYTSSGGNGAIGRAVGNGSWNWVPTALDASDVRIQATVIDRYASSTLVQSLAFTVDSTAPSITSRTPTASATGVALDQTITIVFSEAMDQASVLSGFSISPGLSNPALNLAGDTLTVTHGGLLAETRYTITITGAKDTSTPGLAVTDTWFFDTATNARPTVTVQTPAAGSQYAPGQSISITWTMNDAETAKGQLVVYVNWTSSAGSGAVSGRLVGQEIFTWTAPDIDAGDVVINVTVIDTAGGKGYGNSGAFAIRRGGGLDLVTIGIIGLILIIVVAALLYFLVIAKKRRKKEEEAPPAGEEAAPEEEAPEEEAEPAPPPRAAPRAPAAARAPPPPPTAKAPAAGTRECPSCGTIVDTKDTECFMCGHKF